MSQDPSALRVTGHAGAASKIILLASPVHSLYLQGVDDWPALTKLLFFCLERPDHRMLFLEVILQAADLSLDVLAAVLTKGSPFF